MQSVSIQIVEVAERVLSGISEASLQAVEQALDGK
jgi:hypothetical protein